MSTITKGFLEQVAKDARALRRSRGEQGDLPLTLECALGRLEAAALEVAGMQIEPTPLELDRALVARLLKIDDGLTDWEVEFVESLARWVEIGPLTERQRERAEQLDR